MMLLFDREPGVSTYIERPGHAMEADVAITAVAAKEFAALLILGGRAPEYLRNDTSLLSLAREFSTQNKTVNFTSTSPILPATGSYARVLVTKSFPNSLVGEMVMN